MADPAPRTASASEPLWLVGDAAEFLDVRPQWILEHAASNDLPGYRVGRAWRFIPSELRTWLADVRAYRAPLQAQPEGLWTAEHVARWLGLSKSCIYRHAGHQLPALFDSLRSRVFFSPRAIKQWLADQEARTSRSVVPLILRPASHAATLPPGHVAPVITLSPR